MATATASAARSAACCGRSTRSRASALAASTRARAAVGGSIGDEADRLLVGVEGVVVATALQQAPAAPFVEDGGAGGVLSRVELGEGVGDQLRSPVEVAGPAGDVGRPVDDLGPGHRQVGAGPSPSTSNVDSSQS